MKISSLTMLIAVAQSINVKYVLNDGDAEPGLEKAVPTFNLAQATPSILDSAIAYDQK